MPKPLTVWIKTNCGTFLKIWEYQTNLPASWEICVQFMKQQLEPDMEQWTGWRLGKEYIKAVYCHLAYLTYIEYIMWNAGLEEAQDGIKIARRNINDLRWCHPYCRKWRGTKEPLDESERGEWKTLLKINILKTKIMASGPNTSWQIDGETMETCRLYFLGLQNHCRWWLQPWKEKTLAPWKKSYDQPRQNIKKQKHYFADKGQ